MLHRRLGDNRLIVAGGLADQPAGQWIAAQNAGYVWWLFDHMSKVDDYSTQTTVSADDVEAYFEMKKLAGF